MEYKSLNTPAATGGTVTTTATHRIHTFTSSEIFTANKAMNVEYLVVAGGGGGGGRIGGGGGAGGMRTGTIAITAGNKTVTVGSGGTAGVGFQVVGDNGANSVFDSITSNGGGGGGAYSNAAPKNGGSGGGRAADDNRSAATGIAGQGNNGGTTITGAGSGGGGGAGAFGGNGPGSYGGGIGGAGSASSISGSSVYYAGGGSGGADTGGSPIVGGIGGGGSGANNRTNNATAGGTNTGGGGGGGCETVYYGKAGGSGIVIIRYLLTEDLTPANITATNMTITPNPIPCISGTCIVTIVVRWSNSGGTDGSVIPNIKIDTVSQTAHGSRTVLTGSYIDETFTISGLTTGTHTICPYPN